LDNPYFGFLDFGKNHFRIDKSKPAIQAPEIGGFFLGDRSIPNRR
jgi:hypothetical protein